MGKSSPSPPPAPDPVATANAQTASNVETARTQAALNRVNQYGPDGSIIYNQSPTNGDVWTQYTSLSPTNQAIYDATKQGQLAYTNAATNQIGNAAGALSQPMQNPNPDAQQSATNFANVAMQRGAAVAGQPVNTDYNSVRQQAIDAANSRLDPELKMQEESLRSRLLNSGITEGSEAWNNAYRQFNNAANDSRQQTILNAENLASQAIGQTAQLRQIPLQEAGQVSNLAGNLSNLTGAGLQQATALRDLPLNEASAMLTGQQVGMPQFGAVPQTQVAPTDVIGSTMGSANLANQQYAQRLQANNSQLGGLYGTLGTVAMGAMMLSDKRAKTDIRRVGKTDEGTPIYTYRYKGSDTPQMGVMAQELMKKQPGAVAKTPTGMYAVAYDRVR